LSSFEGANATAMNRGTLNTLGAGDAGLAPSSLALTALAPEQQAFQPISREAAIALNDAIPFSTAPIPAAAPFVLAAAGEQDRERATACLAQAIYYEAGGDTTDDQRAVAQVVLNRVRHPFFPKTVCGVVFQGSQLKTGCQFTFTCDGSMSRPPEAHAWAKARAMAADALNGAVFAPVGYATHFHTPWVGGHLFYRWPGGAGAPRAFAASYAGGELDSIGGGPLPGSTAMADVAPPPAPSVAPVAPVLAPRRIEVATVDLSAAAIVDGRAPLVAGPPPIVLAAGANPAARSYHPPIPRGGSAQPLLSRDR
jgi:hypothetical protein